MLFLTTSFSAMSCGEMDGMEDALAVQIRISQSEVGA